MIRDCYVLDDLSLDDHFVHCQIMKDEYDPSIGILIYLKAMDEEDELYNREYEDDIGAFWQILTTTDRRIVWPDDAAEDREYELEF